MSHHPLDANKLSPFPQLSTANHHVTSQETDAYNCVAWAAGDNTKWWEPTPGFYWPRGALADVTKVESFIEAFATLGYAVCGNGALDDRFEKLAIYVRSGQFQHVALQLADGKWTSKLGELEDIEHDSEQDIEGNCSDCYGAVHTFMRRPRAS